MLHHREEELRILLAAAAALEVAACEMPYNLV